VKGKPKDRRVGNNTDLENEGEIDLPNTGLITEQQKPNKK